MNNHLLKKIAVLGLLNVTLTSFIAPAQANGFSGESDSEFSLIAGDKVFLNSGGNFEGDPNDFSDDALIFANNGFTMNNLGNTILPTKRNSIGGILTDANNLKILVDNAVAVNSSNPQINAPNNPYKNLTPPPQVDEPTVNIPGYEDLITEELSKRDADTNGVSFNAGANPINNVSDWNRFFPAPGSVSEPTVVNVTSGLNIPGGVNLANYIINVNGTVNFNGVSSLDNVVLILNNGGINLGGTQFNNSAIFAPNTINMNSTARFSGDSLIVSGSDVNFDGATVTTSDEDKLRVVAQGSITYNASLDSRSTLLSGNDVNFNAQTTLHGFIAAQSDIRCNSYCSVVGVSNEPPSNEPPSNEPPSNEPPSNEPPSNEPPSNEPPSNEPPNNPIFAD